MILDGQVLGRPLISYKDTQTAIEALTGVVAGMTAYATDTALTGYYTGSAWVWLSVTSGSYVPIVHDITGAYHSTSGRTSGQVLQATGATTFGWSSSTLSISGNSTINGSLVGNMTGGGTVATGGFTLTVPSTGTAAIGAGTLTVSTTNDVTGAEHTHAITSSSNPGAAARVLASDASGFLSLTRIGLGSNTAIDGATIYNGRMITDPNFSTTLFYWYANNTALTVNPSSNTVGGWRAYGASYSVSAIGSNNIGTIYGGVFFAANNSTGTLTTHTAGIFDISANSASTVTSTTGTAASITITKSGAGSWNLTNAYFINCVPQITAGTFAPVNLYGLKISDLTYGTVTNYAISTGLGLVRHGDQVSIVGGANRTQLTVTGFSTQTNTLAQLTRNDGNTSAVVTMLTATVNTTGTAAAGFGGAIALNLESSTTADQAAAALEWSWATATHASRKARVVGKVYDTAARTWLQVDTDGSTSDVLINSLIYGSMYGDDISQLVTVDASSTYYEVGGGLTGGNVNGMTFQNSKELLIAVAGKYLVTWSMSLSAGNNDHLEGAIMINSTVAPSTENAAHTPGAGDQVPVGGSGILSLAVNDVVKLCVENETDTDDITVSHATLTALRIGE